MTAKSYDVGYRKPPKDAQFKKGKSGNPKGRPRGTLNLSTVLARTLRDTIVIKEKGRRRTISKFEAALARLADKAASGNLRALQLCTALVRSVEERARNNAVTNPINDEMDQRVFLGLLKRIEAARQEDPGNEDDTIAE